MRKITTLLFTLTFLLTACTGDQGPPGFDGPQGPPGESAIAFEISGSFNTGNDFQIQKFYDFQVFPDEVVLVYRLWSDPTDDLDVWRLLPQTVYFDGGSDLVYNYDFTQEDVIVFLDSSSNLEGLGPEWTQDQFFRVIIVPASELNNVDVSNFDAVSDTFGITDFPID